MIRRSKRGQLDEYYPLQRIKSTMFQPVPANLAQSAMEPAGGMEDEMNEIARLGIRTVVQLVPNNSTAGYVGSFLDCCSRLGFKAVIGFVDHLVSTGTSGTMVWTTTPVATAIQPNINHAALLAFATIDEPYDVCYTDDMQTLYTQLRTTSGSATYLLKSDGTYVDQFLQFSGQLEQTQGNADKQFETGMCDIAAFTKLCFRDYDGGDDFAYKRDVTINIHSQSRDYVRRAVNPFPYWIQIPAFTGTGPDRMPNPWEINEHLKFVLNGVYPAGRPDRISWQRWGSKLTADQADEITMRDPEAANMREWAARLVLPEVWTF